MGKNINKVVLNGEELSFSGGGGGVQIPSGVIVIWSGSLDNIPDGWALCDGTNSTPDLRDKFVLGAGTSHTVGESGGSEEVTLTIEQMPEHSHDVMLRDSNGLPATPTLNTTPTGNTSIGFSEPYVKKTGSSQPHPNMPPYYTLCYIMKT